MGPKRYCHQANLGVNPYFYALTEFGKYLIIFFKSVSNIYFSSLTSVLTVTQNAFGVVWLSLTGN